MAALCLPATEQLDRLWDEIREASPDAVQTHFPSGNESAVRCPSAVPLRDELRRLKFVFTTAEAQRHFAECASRDSCFAADPPTAYGAVRDQGLEARRSDAKERNKHLKSLIAQEEEVHSQHQREILDAYLHAKHLQEQCLRELQEAALKEGTMDSMMLSGIDFGTEMNGSHHYQNSEETSRCVEDLRQDVAAFEEVASKRQQLEAELRQVEAERKARQNFARTCSREEECERAICAKLDMQDAETLLGFPRIELDVRRGMAVLGGNVVPGSNVELGPTRGAAGEAVFRIEARHDEDGRLKTCVPDPKLGLQREATRAVTDDDLARFLTLAWDRICEGRSQPRWSLSVRSAGA